MGLLDQFANGIPAGLPSQAMRPTMPALPAQAGGMPTMPQMGGLPPGIQQLLSGGFQFGNNAGLPPGMQNFGQAAPMQSMQPTQPMQMPGTMPQAPAGNPFGQLGNPFGGAPMGGGGGVPSWLQSMHNPGTGATFGGMGGKGRSY